MCLLSGLVGCFSLIWRERLVVGSLSAQVVEITLVTWLLSLSRSISLFDSHSPLCQAPVLANFCFPAQIRSLNGKLKHFNSLMLKSLSFNNRCKLSNSTKLTQ